MKTIDLAMTMEGPEPEVRSRVHDRVDQRLRSASLTGREKDGALDYRPKFVGLVIVWLIRRLQDEHVTFTFTQRGPVTEVRAIGKLRDRGHAEVTEAFGGY